MRPIFIDPVDLQALSIQNGFGRAQGDLSKRQTKKQTHFILSISLLVLGIASPAIAQPTVLIFGGGWGPEGTQASIEKHVEALHAVLPQAKGLFFGPGKSASPSVQIPSTKPDPDGELLGLIFGRRDHLRVSYRPSRLKAEPSNKARLLKAISAHTKERKGLVLFGAGHGSPATETLPPRLELWGPNDKLSAQTLAEHLDRARSKGPVAMVLGHCHSGAFADLSYKGANPKNSLALPARCVLAAVPADREASGCTPDISDPDARAYIALIAEAFAQKIDHDRNGKTSLMEAHAHARIYDRTVDVPVSSSEVWMADHLGARAPALDQLNLADLLKFARPTERAVLEQLGKGRFLKQGIRKTKARWERLTSRLKLADRTIQDQVDEQDKLRRVVLDRVLNRWPELANPYHAKARAMLGEPAALVAFIRAQPELRTLKAIDQVIAKKDKALLVLEKKTALVERWLRAVQLVANERAVVGSGRKALESLLACERLEP